jgi:hypothetical protein
MCCNVQGLLLGPLRNAVEELRFKDPLELCSIPTVFTPIKYGVCGFSEEEAIEKMEKTTLSYMYGNSKYLN